MKLSLFILCIVMTTECINAKPQNILISDKAGKDYFHLSGSTIIYDNNDWEVVKKSIDLFAKDIYSVTGHKPNIQNSPSDKQQIVLAGTIGHSRFIDRLIKEGKLDASTIKDGWEQFIIRTIKKPFPNVDEALVIVGSDRRGTAYGIFTVSEKIGVSPLFWWADIPIKKQGELYIKADYTSLSPSVKYRGIFINDEDWGFQPWAAKNYEKDLNDVGPRTYEKVCELILRLKGNMLAPAMHACTAPFYYHPENKTVADEYGIIITTSHCEPLLFNNASQLEWNSKRDGEWNYISNKKAISEKFDNRIREAAPYENIYTVSMRGLHDEGMKGNLSDSDKVKVLTQVINDQRALLQKHLKKEAHEIPQIFVPYKEALDIYELGLKVPEDITLVWPDDNYGYIKRLSNPEEQKRNGSSGIYYHTSYLGGPHDYLWLCTTPPVLMYEELKKAYDTGASRYWLLNVGDIKPSELGMKTFFDMAWSINEYTYENINRHQTQFLTGIFGDKYKKDIQNILDAYYRLAWSRKPEFMGWEREWDAPEYKDLADTDYSFQHYNDAQQRLADYRKISDLSARIIHELPQDYRAAFFEMVGYPAMASYQMNRKFLFAQLNHEQAKEKNFASANWAATHAQAAYDSINSLNHRYNTMLNGKWNHMMMLAPGWVAKYQNMPSTIYTQGVGEAPMDLTPQAEKYKLEGCTVIDLSKYKKKVSGNGHTLRYIKGIGYDWHAIQLGEAIEQTANPQDLEGPHFEYDFSAVKTDSVTIHVYTVPFFPLYKGRSTRFGISIDRQPAFIAQNDVKEFSKSWKDQVLQNGAAHTVKLPIKQNLKKHTIRLICGDPGIIIQRIIIDWGGLHKTYVGPNITVSDNI